MTGRHGRGTLTGGALMYRATEGSSGSDASHERASTEAKNGAATERQQALLRFLEAQGAYGATWTEVGTSLGLHHGQVTGSLSNLHKAGIICRLVHRRGRSSVYVMPEHVDGRPTAEQGRKDPATDPTGYPYRLGAHIFLGPGVTATLDGESVVWNGRRFHPVDSHATTGHEEPSDEGKRPLFDL